MILRVLRKLLQPSRLDEYREIIELALQSGYRITSLADWYNHNFYEGEKVLVLRHDVDLLPFTAWKMFLLEKELGVKSTFYFRWLTEDAAIINKIKAEGFEVSLHFETLATYCKQNRIFRKEDVTDAVMGNCLNILKEEITRFESRYGKIQTLCSHGDKRNRVLGLQNHKIMEHVSRKGLGIAFETYDPDIKSRFENYISDSSINEKHQWKYGTTPKEAIAKGSQSICLLTHPHHWYYNPLLNVKRLIVEYLDNR